MDDDEFCKFLDRYADPPTDPNPTMVGVRLEWIRDDVTVGADHIRAHGVTEQEVEEVILEIPPVVEAKRSRRHPERTLFWGATRRDRWLFVCCEDRRDGGVRVLVPITAFEPSEGRKYWDRL